MSDERQSCSAMKRRLRGLPFAAVECAHDWSSAAQALHRSHDIVLVEATFSDGSDCLDLVRAVAQGAARPIVLVMSDRAPRSLIAGLLLSYADGYLERPIQLSQLNQCLLELGDDVQLCRRAAELLVGRVGLKEAQWYLRGLMSRAAMARAGGNCCRAAAMLQVDRRYVARLTREFRSDAFASAFEAPVGARQREPGERNRQHG
ncbi:MAG: hypothetical protein OXU20_22070 [Myxococcales bacterium]|nr:hypothetical protein [Myxococcales bacterium]